MFTLIDRAAVVLRLGDLPVDVPADSQAVAQPPQEPADYFTRWANDRCRLPGIFWAWFPG